MAFWQFIVASIHALKRTVVTELRVGYRAQIGESEDLTAYNIRCKEHPPIEREKYIEKLVRSNEKLQVLPVKVLFVMLVCFNLIVFYSEKDIVTAANNWVGR